MATWLKPEQIKPDTVAVSSITYDDGTHEVTQHNTLRKAKMAYNRTKKIDDPESDIKEYSWSVIEPLEHETGVMIW